MPIRTPRGRGAAYRPVWQWPLQSPSRLFFCLLVLVTLAVLAHSAWGLVPGHPSRPGFFDRPADGPAAAATPDAGAPAAPTRLPPVPELAPRTLPTADAPKAALSAATRWTEAWARHPTGTTTATWVAGLRPFTTDEYLGVLSTVDPSNVPARRVTGPSRAVLVSPHSVRVQVPTDVVTLVVLVVDDGAGSWKVAGYDRAGADGSDPDGVDPDVTTGHGTGTGAGPGAVDPDPGGDRGVGR